MKIINLEKYGIEETELKTIHNNLLFEITILNKYFSNLEILKPLTPKERRLLIRQKSRDNYKELIKKYPESKYELIGTKIRPIGINGVLTGKQIIELKNCEPIEQIIILKAGKLKKIGEKKEKLYFGVKGLFAIKVEGFDYKNSLRFTEERIIIVKAFDLNKATEIAENEFKNYGNFEYLNSDFKLTKWEYIELLDIYETETSNINDKGTEIFSETKNRKIKNSCQHRV
jgi:hypothetical protein